MLTAPLEPVLSALASDAEWSLHRAMHIGSCTVARTVHLRYWFAESFLPAIMNAHVADS